MKVANIHHIQRLKPRFIKTFVKVILLERFCIVDSRTKKMFSRHFAKFTAYYVLGAEY